MNTSKGRSGKWMESGDAEMDPEIELTSQSATGWTEGDPDKELTPPLPMLRHIWDWDQRWSETLKRYSTNMNLEMEMH